MNQVPIQDILISTEPPTRYATFLPYNGHPLYTTDFAPPGYFLHPKSHEFLPLCPRCSKLTTRTTSRSFICCCAEATPREYLFPLTGLSGAFPIAYTISEERSRYNGDFEPLVATQTDILCNVKHVLTKYFRDMPEDSVDLVAEKTVNQIREALRDRPQRSNFPHKEAMAAAHAVTMGIAHVSRTFKEGMKSEKTPLALHDCTERIYAFVSPASLLVRAAATASPLSADEFQARFADLKAAAMYLNAAVMQAEMNSATFKMALPTAWAAHKLLKGKSWFDSAPSPESWVFFQQTLSKVNQTAQLATASSPAPHHITKMLHDLVHLLLFLARCVARLSRVFFEYSAAAAADELWKRRPAIGFKVENATDPRDPDMPPAPEHLPSWHLPISLRPQHQLQQQPSSSSAYPTLPTRPEFTGFGNTAPSAPASLAPSSSAASIPPSSSAASIPPGSSAAPITSTAFPPGSFAAPITSTAPPSLTSHPGIFDMSLEEKENEVPSPTVVQQQQQQPIPQQQRPSQSPFTHRRGASISMMPSLGLLSLTVLFLALPAMALATSNTTVAPSLASSTAPSDLNVSSTFVPDTMTTDSTTRPSSNSGTFVREGFIYTFFGERLINPHTKALVRAVDTSRLAAIPQLLLKLANTLKMLCTSVKLKFSPNPVVKFKDTGRPTASMIEYFDTCQQRNLVPAVIANVEESRMLSRVMRDNNVTVALAPITFTQFNGVAYMDGTGINPAIFENGLNYSNLDKGSINREFSLNKVTQVLFLYKPGRLKTILEYYDCTSRNGKPRPIICGQGFRSLCKSIDLIFRAGDNSTLQECGVTVDNLQVEAHDMAASIRSSVPQQNDPFSYTDEKPETPGSDTPQLSHAWGPTVPFLPLGLGGKEPINKRRRRKRRFITRKKRAVGVIAAAISFLAISQLATYVNSGISGAAQAQHAARIDQLSITMDRIRAVDAAQDKEISEIASFVLKSSQNLAKTQKVQAYQSMATDLVHNFRQLTNTAAIALNKLALAVTGMQLGKVNPALLTPSDLAAAALQVFVREGISLSRNINEVKPTLYLEHHQLYAAFEVPVKDADRTFDLMRITPVPQFGADGKRVVPLHVPGFAAYQRNGDGFITFTDQEIASCVASSHICESSQPVTPGHLAPCGIAPLLHEDAQCSYEKIENQQDFFYTSGNFTCFSVKAPTKLKAKCLTSPTGDTKRITSMQISQAGCFSFSQLCSLQTTTGHRLLPSTPSGQPYHLDDQLHLVLGGNTHPDATVTDQLPQDPENPDISVVQALTVRQPRDVLDRSLQESVRAYNSFALPSVLVCLILVVILGACIYLTHRRTLTFKRMARRTENALNDHREDSVLFRNRFAIFEHPSRPASMSGTRPSSPLPIVHMVE